MSKNTRWALAIVGAVIIIVAAVVIGTGKDDTDATQAPADNTPAVTGESGQTGRTGATTGPNGVPDNGSGGDSDSGGATPGTPADGGNGTGGASPQEETGGANAQGASLSPVLAAGSTKTVVVDKGETVVIRGRSNSSGEMHLHGYDKEAALVPGKIARIKIKATIDGEFPIEFHLPGGETQVGTLRVNP